MRKTLPAALLVLGLATPAWAGPLTISDIVGQWQNAQTEKPGVDPNNHIVYNNQANQLNDQVRWGVQPAGTAPCGAQPPGGPAVCDDSFPGGIIGSAFNFDPTDNVPAGPGGIVPYVLGTAFVLGDFSHENNPINYKLALTNSVEYAFSFSTNGIPNSFSALFKYDHNETPNGDSPCPVGPNPCADIVTVSDASGVQIIDQAGDLYTFTLLGFSTDGTTFTNQFVSAENSTNSAQLYGRITVSGTPTQFGTVPEPASFVLLGTGIALAVAARRRSKRSAS